MIQAIAKLYPCLYCRQHFAEETLEDPPDVSSRAALSVWLCKRHNTVNKWLGKTEFPCTPEALDRRYSINLVFFLFEKVAGGEKVVLTANPSYPARVKVQRNL